jgi:hypothetical protein
MFVLDAVLRLLKKEEERLNRELSGITAAISVFGETYMNGGNARRLSGAGRTRIEASHRARSAKAGKTRKIVSIKSKRMPPAAPGKGVGAAQKARSTKMKAAKKSA